MEVKMSFEEPTEKVFRERVTVQLSDVKYKEYGMDFIRWRCPDTGKLFEVRVKLIADKKQKIKELKNEKK
jgi:hypothetical protein